MNYNEIIQKVYLSLLKFWSIVFSTHAYLVDYQFAKNFPVSHWELCHTTKKDVVEQFSPF